MNFFSLVSRVTKHDTSVTCAHVHVLVANVHAARGVLVQLVDADEDLASLVAEPLAVDARQIPVVRVEQI